MATGKIPAPMNFVSSEYAIPLHGTNYSTLELTFAAGDGGIIISSGGSATRGLFLIYGCYSTNAGVGTKDISTATNLTVTTSSTKLSIKNTSSGNAWIMLLAFHGNLPSWQITTSAT